MAVLALTYAVQSYKQPFPHTFSLVNSFLSFYHSPGSLPVKQLARVSNLASDAFDHVTNAQESAAAVNESTKGNASLIAKASQFSLRFVQTSLLGTAVFSCYEMSIEKVEEMMKLGEESLPQKLFIRYPFISFLYTQQIL
jgi:hypothetical protein